MRHVDVNVLFQRLSSNPAKSELDPAEASGHNKARPKDTGSKRDLRPVSFVLIATAAAVGIARLGWAACGLRLRVSQPVPLQGVTDKLPAPRRAS